MKNTFRIASILLALVMMLTCFAGCGEDEKSENVYFIGATGPLTGDTAVYGIAVKNGAELAIDEINKAGGLNGVKFKFEIKDDKATPADAATGYDALYDAGMQISLGSVTSGACESFAAKAAKDNLFFITPSASAANVIEGRSNAFRVCFGDPDQGVLAAEEIAKNFDKIGAIYDTSDTYSSGIYDAFKAEMKKLNKEYIEQSFDNENKKDFAAQVEALKDCDVIFMPIYYTEAGLIAKACVAKECDAILYGCDGFDGIETQLKDGSVKNKIKYITPFDINSTEEKSAAFVKAFKAKYNEDPNQFAADGYDAVYVIYEAMKAAGIDDADIDPSDLCDKVVKAITDKSFSYKGVTGGMTWDASGACTKVPVIVELG
ncbi:MAG: amino acid ABC transporter substrate-binding protein [Ruminococcaceae bacterium]|nr:amino acid ABC transporter substrate-binding protein [Oscillospiraceae bacterium]